jgi:hypothetical protein
MEIDHTHPTNSVLNTVSKSALKKVVMVGIIFDVMYDKFSREQ